MITMVLFFFSAPLRIWSVFFRLERDYTWKTILFWGIGLDSSWAHSSRAHEKSQASWVACFLLSFEKIIAQTPWSNDPILPKPELRGFGGDPLTKPPRSGVTSAEVTIICRNTCTMYNMFAQDLCSLEVKLGKYTIYTPVNIAMENGPWMKMYFLLNMGIFHCYMGVSKNNGFPPKSSILIGFSIIFTIHFWGPALFLETPHISLPEMKHWVLGPVVRPKPLCPLRPSRQKTMEKTPRTWWPWGSSKEEWYINVHTAGPS